MSMIVGATEPLGKHCGPYFVGVLIDILSLQFAALKGARAFGVGDLVER